MLKGVDSVTANQAYKQYVKAFRMNTNADGAKELSFKEWLIENKDEAGNLKTQNLTLPVEPSNQGSTNSIKDSDNVDAPKKQFKILGMNPFVGAIVIGVSIYGGYKLYKYFTKSK